MNVSSAVPFTVEVMLKSPASLPDRSHDIVPVVASGSVAMYVATTPVAFSSNVAVAGAVVSVGVSLTSVTVTARDLETLR